MTMDMNTRPISSPHTQKWGAIFCDSSCGPCFGDDVCDICVSDHCNAHTDSYSYGFGKICANDTGLNGGTFFAGSEHFQVKEIEVFEITD
jgi:hypothetical protein